MKEWPKTIKCLGQDWTLGWHDENTALYVEGPENEQDGEQPSIRIRRVGESYCAALMTEDIDGDEAPGPLQRSLWTLEEYVREFFLKTPPC